MTLVAVMKVKSVFLNGRNAINNGLVAILGSESLMEVNKWYYTFGLMQKLKRTLESASFSCTEFHNKIIAYD
jgi:hypothetical protein